MVSLPASDVRERRQFYALLAAFTLVRMAIAAITPVSGDEAYYWACSCNLDWCYFDQPGLAIWPMIPFRAILGENALAVRMPAILASLGIGFVLPPLVKRLGGGFREAMTSYLWMNAMPAFIIGSFYASTDIVMAALFLAATWAAVAIAQGERRAWWGFGAAIGFAFLAKFPGVLVLPAVLAALLSSRTARQDLKTPIPWLAGLLAFALTVPVWIWGVQHDWANIEFQLMKRHEVHSISAKFVLEFLGANLLLATPFLGVAFVPAWWRAIRRRDPAWKTVSVAAVIPLVAFSAVALRERVGAHWGAPSLIALTVMFALQRGDRPRRKLAIAAAIFGGVIAATAIIVAIAPGLVLDRDWSYPGRPDNISTKDLAEAFGNEELLAKIEAIRRPDEIVASESYSVAHLLGFLSGNRVPTMLGNVASGKHGLASLYWKTPEELRGRNVLFVSKHIYSPEPELRKRFARVEALPPIDLMRNGELVRRFVVFRCTDLQKPEGVFTLIPAR